MLTNVAPSSTSAAYCDSPKPPFQKEKVSEMRVSCFPVISRLFPTPLHKKKIQGCFRIPHFRGSRLRQGLVHIGGLISIPPLISRLLPPYFTSIASGFGSHWGSHIYSSFFFTSIVTIQKLSPASGLLHIGAPTYLFPLFLFSIAGRFLPFVILRFLNLQDAGRGAHCD